LVEVGLERVHMIVLKATQDKFLSVLQSISDIVERRYMQICRFEEGVLEDYEPNKVARAAASFFRPPIAVSRKGVSLVNAIRAHVTHGIYRGIAGAQSTAGYFSASKANLRNAP
jgi:hypothetical protein